MFPLHDRTRRLLCRGIFLLCGLLPTVSVLAWSISLHSASHLETWRAKLAAETGLEVRLEKVDHPRPGVTHFIGLQLLDPNSGASVAAAPLVEINNEQPHALWFAAQAEIEAAAAHCLLNAMERQRRGTDQQSQPSWRLAVNELTVHWPGREQKFADCQVQAENSDAGQLVLASLRPTDSANAAPIQLRLEQPKNANPAASQMQVSMAASANTNSPALPCSMIASLLHVENHLGSRSTWSGEIRALKTNGNWQTELAGEIKKIDLKAAVSEQFPHQLSGTADLTVQHALIRDGRLEQCQGLLRCGPGAVGESLLAAAATFMGMKRSGPSSASPYTSTAVIPFAELAAVFNLDARGITIQGRSGGETSVIIRSASGSALLTDLPGVLLPAAALVKTLSPEGRVQVPATKQADWLLQMLPLPN